MASSSLSATGAAPEPFAGPALRVARIDAAGLVARLAREDALAVPILAEPFRAWLLAEATGSAYRTARPVIGSGERTVHQRMEVCDAFPPESRFHRLVAEFQALWDRSLAGLVPYPFEEPLAFRDLMLQRYHPGEVGITPHRDRTAYRNLICLFVLAGRGRFLVCHDRAGSGAREIAHEPGDVVITRAPGLLGSGRRPFHLVRDISETRYVFGLRHERGGAPAQV